MDITIQDNIPIPPSRGRKGKSKYPIADLKPGQSFFVPLTESKMLPENICRYLHNMGHRYGFSVSTRILVENRVRGVRVWRLTNGTKGYSA